jgi:adenosylcobinamide-phosphate synthase
MTLPSGAAAAAGIALGYLADCAIGDPRRRHPVAGFGRLAAGLEQRSYANTRLAGVRHVGALVGGAILLGRLLEHRGRRRPVFSMVLTAAATWTVLGGRSLLTEARIIASQLEADELDQARDRVRNLVGRETTGLSAAEIARATVESVAENTSDAVVAPLFWGAVAGVPGLLGYRAANTLDAMIGHRSARYRRFGWAAARLDDLANWIPARLAGLLAAGLAPIVGGSAAAALATWRRDARQHPSPNAGVVEAAFAGGLGVTLGGSNVYDGRIEDRGMLGDGRTVQAGDIDRAAKLSRAVSVATVVLAVVGSLLRRLMSTCRS